MYAVTLYTEIPSLLPTVEINATHDRSCESGEEVEEESTKKTDV